MFLSHVVCRILHIFITYSDARHLKIIQTKPFFGCIGLTLDTYEISESVEHFTNHYINSKIQKRVSLECLNKVRDNNTASIIILFSIAICTFSKL